MSMITWGVLEIVFNGENAWFAGRPTAVGAAVSAVIGLVGITPACGYVTQMWALFIGFATCCACFFAPKLLKRCGIDDRLDCFAFHGVGGIVGALLTGLFATTEARPNAVQGAFYKNAPQFGIQIVGVLVTVVMSVVGTSIIYAVMVALSKLFKTDFRIAEEHEHDIDASQHGESAYTSPQKTAERLAAAKEAVFSEENSTSTKTKVVTIVDPDGAPAPA
jgi:Amt family ammonium transporter